MYEPCLEQVHNFKQLYNEDFDEANPANECTQMDV